MKKYSKYIFKDMGYLATKLLALVLIVATGVAFLVGLLTTAPNMRYSVEKYYSDYHIADVVIQSESAFSDGQIEELRSRDEIDQIMPYLTVDEPIEINDSKHMARILLLDFDGGIILNQLSLVEGRFPEINEDIVEVVVEKSQVYLMDIEIGYQTTLLEQTFVVVGIVQNPWYFAYVQEVSALNQRPVETMIYADQSFMPEIVFSNLAVTIKESNKFDMFTNGYKAFIDENVKNLKVDFNDYYFTTLSQNQSFVKFQSDVKIVEVISFIFPIFFFMIAILVSISSMTRIISDQRVQIGSLRSLGFDKFKIMGKYLLYALISSSIGTLLGIALGIYLIPSIIYNAYLTSYNLPALSIEYHYMYISIISLIMIASVVLVTFISLNSVLREKTSELLKVKTPKPGKKIFLERLPFIWNRMKFKYKSTFRNIFRHKRNLFLMLVGISGSTALLLTGFGIKNAVDYAGKYQYEQMLKYDLEIGTNPNMVDIAAINQYEKINVMLKTALYNNEEYMSLIIPDVSKDINSFIQFKDTKRNDIDMMENSVMVTNDFAAKQGIKEGSVISIEFQGIESEFMVTAVIDYYFGDVVYISSGLIASNYSLEYNAIYVTTGLKMDAEKDALRDELKNDENVINVSFKEDIKYSFNKTSESMNGIIVVLILFACALAIIINYNISLINIVSRNREIATLKVLGYQEIEVTGYMFRESAIISTISILVGLGLGRLLHFSIISSIIIDGVRLSNQVDWLSYILTLVLAYVFLGFVYLISYPKIKSINMIDALKSFE